ncbi:MAG: Threonine-tRNA ligase [Microgenomates group bacterium GW2011_GWC1_43_11]|uniref:Threonine--tRNA ligase n=2 Tax=Candidatus Gottesmaniibacteriota TaxID=1752720 RepID=A0A0G1IQT0_9BACT|nr:MAG: Threonine-tRNA ligase [Microgenomates group bacterium GW2011_GWC1_43_11]KKT39053.1 MAG: Threonine-tRNA ligase [Candidatus Gottesmanbacteria bacterium GW2011_GWB1_44_11c]KKT61515.1 MAG: Threonine-tRNA ligase [Candidatus Gottesmanbacteria bacterium GW2011_GWA1_44_24b]HCM81913.1 threonine--tRNA ligase [Patescibacteria group bacterium]
MSKILDKKLQKMSEKELQLWALRHTAEHVLHTALQNLYPELKKAMGPATADGFYHDFDPSPPAGGSGNVYKISEEDFPKIEREMQRLIDADLPMVQKYISGDDARQIFQNNPYKLEWVDDIQKRGEKISIYSMGNKDVDLCSGPHIKSTGEIKAFKLLSIAGAYWHGDEKNKMLTRVYGTAFPTQKELDDYLFGLEEAKKRDHRKLGQELDLFSISPLTGQGLILWHPRLSIVRNVIEQFWRDEHYKRDYQLVFTPHIGSVDMFVKSRHLSKYINYMFPIMLHEHIEGESAPDYTTDEVLKPMNCPNHIQIYKARPRSYRELPMRIGELGTVYRYERAGVLHGMTRVRGFTQDDSHIFCTPDQVIGEVREVLKIMKDFYKIFGFSDYQAYIATRPEKYLGGVDAWNFAEASLKKAAKEEGFYYKIDEGAGVFYGPKIDMKVKDSLGREWQLGTVQFDFNQPDHAESTEQDIDEFWALKTFKQKFKTRENLARYIKRIGRGFDVTYITRDGKEEHCVMIHRVVLGSMERFFGILIEHYGGAFPTWLNPIQVRILPIADRHLPYARKICETLKKEGIRVELDDRNETLNAKIRKGQQDKVSYLLIIGDKEMTDNTISVRDRSGKNTNGLKIDDLINDIQNRIKNKII